MPYTTTSPPVLVGRPGYSAEHYDFAFSGLGDWQADKARQLYDLAMKGEYRKVGAEISGYGKASQDYFLTYLKRRLDSSRYQLVTKYVKPAGANGSEGGASAAWSFIKGQLSPSYGGGVPAGGGPNYLLWGGLAAGGLVLVLLLTRKPKQKAPTAQ